jgi:hypothetical protein
MNTCTTCGYSTFAEIPPVPAPNLLESNDAPSPEEALSIQATISVVDRDLWQLSNEIGRTQTHLNNLIRNHKALRTYHLRQVALLSPSRRLPPEILSEILLTYVIGCQGGNMFPAREDALLTTQICRYWTDVAISTPRLWSALCFELRTQDMNRELEMAPIWLARSGGAPLTLGLHSHGEMLQSHPIIDMILPHAPRFVTLFLNTRPYVIYGLRNAKGRIPCLRNLILHPSNVNPSMLPHSLDAFEIAPQLRSLSLIEQLSVLKPEFAWAQLRELALHPDQYTVNDCLEILHNSPNLEVCSLSPKSLDHFPHMVVKNNSLRQLRVAFCKHLAPLFAGLALPALVDLSCSFYGVWPQHDFLSFMRRSPFALQKLRLINIYDDEGEYSVAECLRHTGNLLELELLEGSGRAINEEFLRYMTHRGSLSCLLPKLRRLKVTRDISFDYNAFATMVESRWRQNASHGVNNATVERIQRVEICFMDDYERYDQYDLLRHNIAYSDSFALLRQLRAEGLNLISPHRTGRLEH